MVKNVYELDHFPYSNISSRLDTDKEIEYMPIDMYINTSSRNNNSRRESGENDANLRIISVHQM